MTRHRYTYMVVTHNGAGVHAEYPSCGVARKAMVIIAKSWTPDSVFEIQRVRHLGRGGRVRQYQMREGSRWVEWDPKRRADVRKPDWQAVSGGRS